MAVMSSCRERCYGDIPLLPSSVVVHCGCDGHAPPDLSPSNQTDGEKKERRELDDRHW